MAVYDEDITRKPLNAGAIVNYAGAFVSLALIAGVAVWGYKLVMRDVTGIPVVRAMAGEMRVAPQDPGGDVANHEGLSVNEVAAVGEAAGPEDRLLLAPATPELAEEDLAVQPLAEEGEVRATEAAAPLEATVPAALSDEVPAEGPLTADDVLALADQIASGTDPLTALAEGVDVAPEVSVDGEVVEAATEVVVNGTQVAASLRPMIRPQRGEAAIPASIDTDAVNSALAAALGGGAEASTTETATAAVTTTEIATGTNLVQLGAYPTAQEAAEAWDVLAGGFGDYMTGKERVIQEATSGGQTFFRLRASGFAELGDARRFCAALIAGNADCLPVVVN